MTTYRIPIIYDASHYKNKSVEGKDVGTWMTKTLAGVLAEHGFQSDDPGNFRILTEEQKDSDEKIFVGQLVSADQSGVHTISIKDETPRELTITFDGQASKTASNEDIINEFRTLLEKSFFIREKHQFEKAEDVGAGSADKDNTEKEADGNTAEKEAGTGGCYIATAVYGSYDCPEVWTLRRFRDERLLQTILGRLFVKGYYTVSPSVVKVFGRTTWFNHFWRKKLDRMVLRLKKSGYKDTPYNDRQDPFSDFRK